MILTFSELMAEKGFYNTAEFGKPKVNTGTAFMGMEYGSKKKMKLARFMSDPAKAKKLKGRNKAYQEDPDMEMNTKRRRKTPENDPYTKEMSGTTKKTRQGMPRKSKMMKQGM